MLYDYHNAAFLKLPDEDSSWRNASGQWVLYTFGPGDEVEFTSVDLRCEIAALYEDVPDVMPG